MQRIPQNAIVGWSGIGQLQFAGHISTRCPFCGVLATFSAHSPSPDINNHAVGTSATCPKCKATFRLFNVRHANLTDVYMYPAAHETYQSVSIDADFPDPLKRSFQAALDAFDAGNYPATAVTAGRTLEGIFKYLVPPAQRGQKLAKLIDAVVASDLAQSIRDLGHALRDGRNIAAHFDLEAEPNKDLARHMIELLDYLISYLYVLPKRIDNLRSVLDKDDSSRESVTPKDIPT
jgi:Domain of unknown function (DUF4145)